MKKFNQFIPFVILLFLLGVIAISTYKINNKQQIQQEDLTEKSENRARGSLAEVIALPEFSLPDLFNSNQEFSRKDLVKKYSLVNFFASWCSTCRAEHEALLRLKDSKIIAMYGIAWRDIDENAKIYLQNNGNPFDKVAIDNKGLFTKIININAVPETLIIDFDGNVVLRYTGNLEESAIAEIEQFLASNK